MTGTNLQQLRAAISATQTAILEWLEQHGAGNPDHLCDAAIMLCEASTAVVVDVEQGIVHERSAKILYFVN